MCRKELFQQLNSLEARKEKTLQEAMRATDYRNSLENYLQELESKIAKLRKEINQTANRH